MTNAHRLSGFSLPAMVAFLLAAGQIPAADYPIRPIRLVVPFPAGGGADTLARIFAPRLAEALGQQVVVDNRSGAAGNIATEIVAKAVPDGYTAMLTLNSVLTMNPSFYPSLPFNIETDLQPVTQLSAAQYMLLLHPAVPAASVKELLELAKAKPGALTYASAGVGSATHLAAELLKWRAGVNLTHVPYKGATPSVFATMMGESQITFASVAASLQYVQSGKLKALAVTALKRSAAVPELPTLDESGIAGYNVISWHALLVTAKTPDAIVAKLHRTALEVAKSSGVAEAMARQGMETTTGSPSALAALIKSETATWRGVIKAANIRAE
jgi:tripartite-type tricarboxylate transporter receptor subunit TctC